MARTRPAPPPARRSRPGKTVNAPRGASRRPTRITGQQGRPALCRLPARTRRGRVHSLPPTPFTRKTEKARGPACGRPAPDRSHPADPPATPRPPKPGPPRRHAPPGRTPGWEPRPRSPSPRATRGRTPHPVPPATGRQGHIALARYVLPCHRGAGVHTGRADRRVHRRVTGGSGARRWAQSKLSEPPAGQPPAAAASAPASQRSKPFFRAGPCQGDPRTGEVEPGYLGHPDKELA